MDEIERQIISPSGKYKATVLEKADCYKLELYVRSQDFDPETGIIYGEYWSRKNTTPILIDKSTSPEYFAIQEMRVLMGDPDSPLSIEWVRDFSFCRMLGFCSIAKLTSFVLILTVKMLPPLKQI